MSDHLKDPDHARADFVRRLDGTTPETVRRFVAEMREAGATWFRINLDVDGGSGAWLEGWRKRPEIEPPSTPPTNKSSHTDPELAHATAQGAEQVPGARFLPVQPAAASPERPAAAADF